MAKIIIFSLFVNFPTLMANTIDIGGLLNQAGGANGGLDVGSILNNIIRKASLFFGGRSEKRLGRSSPPQNSAIGGSMAL